MPRRLDPGPRALRPLPYSRAHKRRFMPCRAGVYPWPGLPPTLPVVK